MPVVEKGLMMLGMMYYNTPAGRLRLDVSNLFSAGQIFSMITGTEI